MIAALDWCSGICWSIVYILAIVVGFRKKTYCIPWLCICLNFSWELLVVVKRYLSSSFYELGFVAQILWLLLDIVVLATWIMYDYKKTLFAKALAFVGAFVVMYCWTFCANMWEISAFVINLLMSVLFLCRKPGVWSLKSIALLKMIGTISATVLNGWVFDSLIIVWLGGLIFIVDAYYFFGLCFKPKEVEYEKND